MCVGLREVGTQPPAVETVHNLITARRVTDMDSTIVHYVLIVGRERQEKAGGGGAIKIDGGQVKGGGPLQVGSN